MLDSGQKRQRHLLLSGFSETEAFKTPKQGGSKRKIPERDRQSHGKELLRQISALESDFSSSHQAQVDSGLEEGFGLQIEFQSFPDIELAFERLARERSGVELLNVQHDAQRTLATVFVPDGKLKRFEALIGDYLEEKHDRAGRPRDNKDLINAIEQIRTASLRALWTDNLQVFPQSDDETFWWEVWLPIRHDRAATVAMFRRLAEAQGFKVSSDQLEFPERTVLLVFASATQIKRSMMTINCIAELRRAKETAEFFDSLAPLEQRSWLDELLERLRFRKPADQVPHLCLLDTGVNNAHPLIGPALDIPDLHTVEPAWDTDDREGHGTQMAGLALFGDLTGVLDSNRPIQIGHRLESVKLLPQNRANGGDTHLHGFLTSEAVARPEITAPDRSRVYTMAVTARDNRDRGRPSAWSATLDRLAADAEGGASHPRLFIISAGNIDDLNAWMDYPQSNSTDSIHDPGQAWNALTVGAYTALADVRGVNTADYGPIARPGGLSPFSTTSQVWQPQWPLKPDVVFEGGNAAKDTLGAVWLPSLSLLTTYHFPHERLFTTSNATSAATALAARMAGQLMEVYPEFWPETVRALMVHSAQWTEEMKHMFLPRKRNPSKTDYSTLVRHCGFGVPDLDRALWSVSNSLTLVVQDSLHPFQKEENKDPRLREMHLHRLPWPLEELESLGETPVEMRVTLSYFIEPNPSERGFRDRYRYESYGLRFDVKRPHETEADFLSRINSAARDEEEGTRSGSGADSGWQIGYQNRHKGSLHSDIWQGSATDLASRGVLGVFPAVGWWKTRPKLQRYGMACRYALVISIHAPEVEVDLYSAVANRVLTQVNV